MKMDCIIIEDEPLALERTRNFTARLPYLNLVGSFGSAIEALAFLRTNHVDVIFLDINLDELSGIQLLESTKIESEVIITTAYNEYALKGFDLSVTDYLLKPFTFERFFQAVNKAQDNLERKEPAWEKRFIFVKTEYRLEKVLLADILYIEGMRDYRRIHTSDRRIMTLQTFKDLESKIPRNVICRVHKSFMVSIDKITTIERDRIRVRDMLIPVSETYKKEFLQLISHLPL